MRKDQNYRTESEGNQRNENPLNISVLRLPGEERELNHALSSGNNSNLNVTLNGNAVMLHKL